MSTITQEPASAVPQRPHWSDQIRVREMWASLAISVMWLAVLFAAVFGPDIVSTSSGGNSTTIPSAVAVALFAAIGTRGLAKYAFGGRVDDGTERSCLAARAPATARLGHRVRVGRRLDLRAWSGLP